jgi:hypothetical protein
MKKPAEQKNLSLQSLKAGMPGMEPALAESCGHAAGVCLEHGKHVSGGTPFSVDGAHEAVYAITLDPVTEQMRRSWSDLQDATEWGASGVAALLVEDIFGYQILQRSWKRTGFDYWIGSSNNTDFLFQNKARLEVSGILNGTDGDISNRIKDKQRRFSEHPHDLPSMVVVVEFGTPRSRIAD